MTKDEALKLALEALENIGRWLPTIGQKGLRDYEADAITAIKEALAQPAQEPVAELLRQSKENFERNFGKSAAADWVYHDVAELLVDVAQPAQEPRSLLTEADVCAIAELHGINANTKGLYGFYVDCVSTTPAAQPAQEPVVIDGNTSDGYHTFNELYEFRKAYNAALFNEWAVGGRCSVHKSWRHHDGELCFGGGWFIVVAFLPSGQISNHYEAKDWDLFAIPETERALFEFDNHTSNDVVARLKAYTTPPKRPWVGLTDDEVDQFHNWKDRTWSTNELVRYVEAKLKEKNT